MCILANFEDRCKKEEDMVVRRQFEDSLARPPPTTIPYLIRFATAYHRLPTNYCSTENSMDRDVPELENISTQELVYAFFKLSKFIETFC